MGAPANAGTFAAWCDLREIMPYAFGYMMSAKVGTGLVAEIGAMRISDEIDALEVMGINSLVYLCATRLLAAWMVLPFMYIAAVGAGFFASYLAVVQQIGEVSSGGYFLIFWMFQNPPDLFFSLIKGMAMATVIVLVGCYYGYTARRRAGRGGHGDGQVDGAQHRDGAPRGHGRHADILGLESTRPDWGMTVDGIALLTASRTQRTRAPADQGAARRALRQQVARLEQELTELECSAWPRTDIPVGVRDRGGARVLSLGELEGLRDRLAGETGRLRRALDERGGEEERSRRLLEEMLLEPRRHPGARVSAADLGEPSCREWVVSPRFGVLGRLMRWWRVRISSGCP